MNTIKRELLFWALVVLFLGALFFVCWKVDKRNAIKGHDYVVVLQLQDGVGGAITTRQVFTRGPRFSIADACYVVTNSLGTNATGIILNIIKLDD